MVPGLSTPTTYQPAVSDKGVASALTTWLKGPHTQPGGLAMVVIGQQFGTPVSPVHRISLHAQDQMDARSISADALRSALKYGRAVWTRGARIFAIGRKEVQEYGAHGVDLARFEGIHVVERRLDHYHGLA
jgi:hypothetical protein